MTEKKIAARERAWAKRLMDNYKLTVEQWWKIYNFQHGVCYICHRPERRPGQRLAVDHDHKDGLVRGLACSQCNPWIGKIERAFVRLGLHKAGLVVSVLLRRAGDAFAQPPATTALGAPHYGYTGRTGTKKHRKVLERERKAKENNDSHSQSMGRKK